MDPSCSWACSSTLLFMGCCLSSAGRFSEVVSAVAGFAFTSSFINLLAELVPVGGSYGLLRTWSTVSWEGCVSLLLLCS